MSETLRDLVVSLSLNSDHFTRNIKSINKQIQEAESAFRLASAGVENFETTTVGLSFKLSTLQRTFQLQGGSHFLKYRLQLGQHIRSEQPIRLPAVLRSRRGFF